MLDESNKTSVFADLYPDLSPEEREEAIFNLERYLEVVFRISEELDQ